MSKVQAAVAHALISVLLLVIVVMQIWGVPDLARSTAWHHPEASHLQTPYTAVAIAGLVCVQVILVGIGMLVHQVRPGGSPTEAALTWVSVMIRAAWAGSALSTLVAIHMLAVEGIGGPAFMWVVVAVVGFCLLAIAFRALRALVVHAHAGDTELAQVI